MFSMHQEETEMPKCIFLFPATLSVSCSRCFWESLECLLKLDHSVSPPPPLVMSLRLKLIWMLLYGVLVSFATYCVIILCSVHFKAYEYFIGHSRLLNHHLSTLMAFWVVCSVKTCWHSL